MNQPNTIAATTGPAIPAQSFVLGQPGSAPTVTINQSEVEDVAGFGLGTSIAQMLDHLRADFPAGHVLASVTIDGVAWRPDRDHELAAINLADIESLVVETAEPATAAADGLEEVQSVAEAARIVMTEGGQALRLGEIDKGIQAAFIGLDATRDIARFASLYLGYADHDETIKTTAAAIDGRLISAMHSFEAACNAEDFNLAADILEYECAEIVYEYVSILTNL